MENKPNYYFIAVSTRFNLDACIKYGLAGFTNSKNGAWAFMDINDGDFISFVYGARAYNLYKVSRKTAIKNAENLPPWENIIFKESGKIYYFPFRVELTLVREFSEPIVRLEFAYIAENLLLRGGYKKTHFQADQTTLQNVSSMGKKFNDTLDKLEYEHVKYFTPKLTFDKNNSIKPYIYKFEEVFLQSIIKHKLSINNNIINFFEAIDFQEALKLNLEALSERALTQGLIDVLLKESIPIGTSKQIVIEIKTNKASIEDLEQVEAYVKEIGQDCIGGILIAKDFQKNILKNNTKIKLVKYEFKNQNETDYYFEFLVKNLILSPIN